MIYTLTLNAAIDMAILSPTLKKNEVTRSNKTSFSPNGKGVNVSIVLDHFNVKNKIISVLGGFTGRYIHEELVARNHHVIPVWVEEDTRLNVFINQGDDEYKVVSKGAYVSLEKQKEILSIIENAVDLDCLVVSGSLPPGIEEHFLLDIIDVCKKNNIDFVFDISSPILKDIISKGPLLIKPNDDEIREIFGFNVNNEEEIIEALLTLRKMGAKNIMLTLGNKGMYVLFGNKIYYANAVEIKLLSSACAGDSSLAAFLSSMDKDIVNAIKLASATGANVAESEGIGDLKNVENYIGKVNVREVAYE